MAEMHLVRPMSTAERRFEYRTRPTWMGTESGYEAVHAERAAWMMVDRGASILRSMSPEPLGRNTWRPKTYGKAAITSRTICGGVERSTSWRLNVTVSSRDGR